MSLNKLILLDFPSGYKLGIDLREWIIGPNFKGIKEIPDGSHYVYYGPDKETSNIGFFIYLSGGEIIVKKWSTDKEDFLDYIPSEDDLSRYNDNHTEIDRHLGKYFMDNHIDWWSLSDLISPELIKTLMPNGGRIYSVEQFLSKTTSTEDRKKTPPKVDKNGLIELEVDPACKINFTEIPRYLFPEGTVNRTKYMLDKTYTLDKVLASNDVLQSNCKSLLGELQFSFVTYNLGYVLAGFEQWLSIIELLTSCPEAIVTRHDLYTSFIAVVHFQMKLTDEDFADIITSKNKFFIYMKKFFELIFDEENATDELKIKATGLKEMMKTKYEWDFDEELDDEQPVLVDMADFRRD